MKVITVMSQKGGAGKTTLAVHLAATAVADRNMRVVIFDTDPQKSACVWAQNRESPQPAIVPVTPAKLAASLAEARNSKIDLVIVDTAPNAGPDALAVARLADLAVIPVRPSMFDLSAVRRTLEIVKKAGTEGLVVLSACPLRAPEIGMAGEALEGSGVAIAETAIGDRRPFSRAIQSGRAVNEFEPAGKAAEEINALLKEILQ